MSKISTVRRAATAVAAGGGGLTFLGGFFYGLLRVEAKIARHRIGDAVHEPLDPGGLYGALQPGHPIRLAILGDSAAAGYGAPTPQETFGAYMATGLSMVAKRPVLLQSEAVVGATSTDVVEQVPLALQMTPDVCVILVGANDITHWVRQSKAIRGLQEVVETLRAGRPGIPRTDGPSVVVGTCPDLGTVRPISPPLRQVARRGSRRLAAAQTMVAIKAGATTVSLGSILGPEFAAAPSDMFGPDHYHPSPAGYKSCAAAMLPTVAAAVGIVPDGDTWPEPLRGEGLVGLSRAAATAVASSGTEVSPDGSRPHRRGRLVRLRRRRRHRIPAVADVPVEDAESSIS